MTKNRVYGTKENERARASSLLASGVSAERTINTVVRRMGVVGAKALDAMMADLIASDSDELAMALNNALKPIVDMMLHFDITQEGDTEVDNEIPK